MLFGLNKLTARLLIVGATIMVVLGWFGLQIYGNRSSWMAYYSAGRFLLDGRIAQVYDFPTLQKYQQPLIGEYIVTFLYAPIYSIAFVPLSVLPVSAARFVWLIVSAAVGVGASWLSKCWSGLNFPASILALIAFPPFIFSLAVGQISAFTLLIFTSIAYLEWREQRGYLAGMFAGLVMYKPQLLIPLLSYWLFKKRWKNLGGFVISALIVLVSSFVLNPKALKDFISLTGEFTSMAQDATSNGANASVYAISPWFGYLSAIGVIIVLYFTSRRETTHYTMALVWTAPVLTTPYIVGYDLLLVFLPVTFLVPFMKNDRPLQVAVALIWITPLLAIFFLSYIPVTLSILGFFAICTKRLFQTTNKRDFPSSNKLDLNSVE